MKTSTNENLVLALIKNNEAKKLFEYVRHETEGSVKYLINRLINRCEANEADIISKFTCSENREIFIKQIRQGDTLQFSYMMMQFFELGQEKRDIVEKMINEIHKGEQIKIEEAA